MDFSRFVLFATQPLRLRGFFAAKEGAGSPARREIWEAPQRDLEAAPKAKWGGPPKKY